MVQANPQTREINWQEVKRTRRQYLILFWIFIALTIFLKSQHADAPIDTVSLPTLFALKAVTVIALITSLLFMIRFVKTLMMAFHVTTFQVVAIVVMLCIPLINLAAIAFSDVKIMLALKKATGTAGN
jgi:hypothetical protein